MNDDNISDGIKIKDTDIKDTFIKDTNVDMNTISTNNATNVVNLSTGEKPVDEMFVARLKQQLDSEQDQLSPSIAAKLRQARASALQHAQTTRLSVDSSPGVIDRFFSLFSSTIPRIQSPWLTACASTLAVVVVIAFVQLNPQFDNSLAELDTESDILFAEDDLELYEDLEFYHWLANTGY